MFSDKSHVLKSSNSISLRFSGSVWSLSAAHSFREERRNSIIPSWLTPRSRECSLSLRSHEWAEESWAEGGEKLYLIFGGGVEGQENIVMNNISLKCFLSSQKSFFSPSPVAPVHASDYEWLFVFGIIDGITVMFYLQRVSLS